MRVLIIDSLFDFLDTYKGYALGPGRDIRVSLSVPLGG